MNLVAQNAKSIAAGFVHSMLLKQDGSVWGAGANNFGQLGAGSRTLASEFLQVISDGAQIVTAGDWHSIILKQDGSLWATGANDFGQLGGGSAVKVQTTFVLVLPSRDGACCTMLYMTSMALVCSFTLLLLLLHKD